MIKFLFLLALYTPNNVNAAGEFTNYRKILFQKADSWVPANKTCISGNLIFHKTRDFVEKIRCSNDSKDNCSVWRRVPLVQPIESAKIRCISAIDESCSSKESVSFVQGPYVKFDVYHSYRDFKENVRPKRSGWHMIDSCR